MKGQIMNTLLEADCGEAQFIEEPEEWNTYSTNFYVDKAKFDNLLKLNEDVLVNVLPVLQLCGWNWSGGYKFTDEQN